MIFLLPFSNKRLEEWFLMQSSEYIEVSFRTDSDMCLYFSSFRSKSREMASDGVTTSCFEYLLSVPITCVSRTKVSEKSTTFEP